MNLPIKSMTTAEKIAAMEELWTALQSNFESVSSPEWHGEVLSERQSRIENGETSFSTLEEVRDRLESRYK